MLSQHSHIGQLRTLSHSNCCCTEHTHTHFIILSHWPLNWTCMHCRSSTYTHHAVTETEHLILLQNYLWMTVNGFTLKFSL